MEKYTRYCKRACNPWSLQSATLQMTYGILKDKVNERLIWMRNRFICKHGTEAGYHPSHRLSRCCHLISSCTTVSTHGGNWTGEGTQNAIDDGSDKTPSFSPCCLSGMQSVIIANRITHLGKCIPKPKAWILRWVYDILMQSLWCKCSYRIP